MFIGSVLDKGAVYGYGLVVTKSVTASLVTAIIAPAVKIGYTAYDTVKTVSDLGPIYDDCSNSCYVKQGFSATGGLK